MLDIFLNSSEKVLIFRRYLCSSFGFGFSFINKIDSPKKLLLLPAQAKKDFLGIPTYYMFCVSN